MAKSVGIGLETFLKKYLDRYSDIKSITLSTAEGTQLCTAQRLVGEGISPASLAPSFTVSVDQSSRLSLGSVHYALLWKDGNIIIQFKVDLIVVAILFDGDANIGLMEEFVPSLSDALKPHCAALSQQN